jgi:endonuclease YncB( thermonuclease family)/predicted flap endonuclease-1-like 5' DNA nuclease
MKARPPERFVAWFVAAFVTISPVAAGHSAWTTLRDCHYVTNQANDGDSFHVTTRGKQYLFRLYFVDAPEMDSSLSDRIDEQAKYFGITAAQTIGVGKLGKEFTQQKLTRPFTVRTCFQDALGRSKMERFYAIVQTTTGDLGEQLIENGLARIHGASANPVGLPRANVEWQKLKQLERNAKREKVGGWGVNFGRMLVRSESSKTRVPIDPFDAFFHPEKVQTAPATPSASVWPFPKRESPRARKSTNTDTNPSRLDINSATQDQLEDIPGIGPTLAGRITSARPFNSADDLRSVKGIGNARYEKLRPYFQ